MNWMMVIGTVGWIGFIVVGGLYYVGNRLNSEESNALALYCLALVLLDEFRAENQTAIKSAVLEGRNRGIRGRALIYCAMQGVTHSAKTGYRNPATNLATVVSEALGENLS